ncbi:MAG: hypothetical protein ABR512_14790 [Desulfopila sp.]
MISIPYTDAAGILADNWESGHRLLIAALTLADELDADHLELRQDGNFQAFLQQQKTSSICCSTGPCSNMRSIIAATGSILVAPLPMHPPVGSKSNGEPGWSRLSGMFFHESRTTEIRGVNLLNTVTGKTLIWNVPGGTVRQSGDGSACEAAN